MTLRLILIRHGLSSFNLQNRIQGRNDLSKLTEDGIVQAKKSGQELKDISIQGVYSSPLQRAADTTKELIKCREDQLNIIYNKNLLEVDLAQWSGMTTEQVKSEFPEQYLIWKGSPHELILKREDNSDYKPIEELMEQGGRFLENIFKNHNPSKDENLLIVGHNAILRCIVLKLLGEPANGFRRIRLDNASISIVKINPDSTREYSVQIESLNGTSHLEEQLPVKGPHARIILVRHGETNWNREGRFQGQIDIPLNETGKKQASAAKEFLSGITFDKAYSSSMSRPLETAQIILEDYSDIGIQCTDELVEIGHGLWEGKLESEINDSWGDLLKEWQATPEEVQMPEGENIQAVWTRAVNYWDVICNSLSSKETALVVAHDAVNKTILCHLLGLTPADIWMIKQGNGGVTIIDLSYGSEQPSIVTSLNITSHLGGVFDRTAQGAL